MVTTWKRLVFEAREIYEPDEFRMATALMVALKIRNPLEGSEGERGGKTDAGSGTRCNRGSAGTEYRIH